MKLLPTGRKSSLAIFVYSSVVRVKFNAELIYLSLIFIYMIMIHVFLMIYQVGLGTFLLRYIPGLVRSLLTEIGISEDMYNPVSYFELFC